MSWDHVFDIVVISGLASTAAFALARLISA